MVFVGMSFIGHFFSDVAYKCISARSHACNPEDLPSFMDLEGLLHSGKIFVAVVILPTLSAPLAALHGFGLYRCGRTISMPYAVPQPMFESNDIQVVVHRRKYDRHRNRIVDEGCFFDAATIERGMKVAGSRRDEFVDDPNEPGTSYFVMERRKMNKKYMQQGQSWLWGAMDDFLMYGVPLFICLSFFKPARQFHEDIWHWARGRLNITQIRHPIGNFFLGINDYNRAKMRKGTPNGSSASMKPWNYKM